MWALCRAHGRCGRNGSSYRDCFAQLPQEGRGPCASRQPRGPRVLPAHQRVLALAPPLVREAGTRLGRGRVSQVLPPAPPLLPQQPLCWRSHQAMTPCPIGRRDCGKETGVLDVKEWGQPSPPGLCSLSVSMTSKSFPSRARLFLLPVTYWPSPAQPQGPLEVCARPQDRVPAGPRFPALG